MEETNVTMTAAEMQGEPAAKENETKAEKFIRIGEYRMNKAVDAIGRLEISYVTYLIYFIKSDSLNAHYRLDLRKISVRCRKDCNT